jgi:hypothetical protein
VTRLASDHQAREWVDNPLHHLLLQVLQAKRDQLVREYLAGRPLDPFRQGQAAVLQWACQLLDLPPDQLMAELHKEYQQDHPQDRKEFKE